MSSRETSSPVPANCVTNTDIGIAHRDFVDSSAEALKSTSYSNPSSRDSSRFFDLRNSTPFFWSNVLSSPVDQAITLGDLTQPSEAQFPVRVTPLDTYQIGTYFSAQSPILSSNFIAQVTPQPTPEVIPSNKALLWVSLFNAIISVLNLISMTILAWISNHRARAELLLKQLEAALRREEMKIKEAEATMKLKQMELEILKMEQEIAKARSSPLIILTD